MIDFPLLWVGAFALVSCAFLLCWRVVGWRLGIVLSVLVFALYHYWGGYEDFVHVKAYRTVSKHLEGLAQQKSLQLGQVLATLEILKPQVKTSHKGLARLASIYSELGQYSEGALLLEKAMMLAPSQRDYILQWVYHQSFLHQGKLPVDARKRLEGVVDDPEIRAAALNMLAMDDYFKEDYNAAIAHWSLVLESDDTLTLERRKVLESALANARAKMAGVPKEEKNATE